MQWQHAPFHPDVLQASSLLLDLKEMVACTRLCDWRTSVGPVVGNLVDDAKQFESFGGTAACFCDWLSDSANLYVTDLRLTFTSESMCKDYHRQALSSNAEVNLSSPDGTTITQMVELEAQSQGSSTLSMVGSSCHVFCGPTQEARNYLASSLAGGGEIAVGPETITKRVEKAMHLVYLFHVDRIVCKLCVTAFNGLIPFGYAFALAKGCHDRMKQWSSISQCPSVKIEDKATLREILKRRALERMVLSHAEDLQQPSWKETYRRKAGIEQQEGGKELYFKLSLFVASLGTGHLIQGSNACSKNFERLETLCTKIPKDQVIPIEFPATGRAAPEHVEVKLRLFVSRSEDAKAVQNYIGAHSKQRPSPFVLLFENLPVAVKYHEALQVGRRELSPAVADRLRKQAKSRAVRFVRRILGEAARRLTIRELMGNRGPNAVAALLAGMLPHHLTTLPGGGQKVLLLTSDDEPSTPLLSTSSTEKPDIKVEGKGRARRWAFDDVEGIDGLMALCQSPAASKSPDWGAGLESSSGPALRSGRRRIAQDGSDGNCNGQHEIDDNQEQYLASGKRQCRV